MDSVTFSQTEKVIEELKLLGPQLSKLEKSLGSVTGADSNLSAAIENLNNAAESLKTATQSVDSLQLGKYGETIESLKNSLLLLARSNKEKAGIDYIDQVVEDLKFNNTIILYASCGAAAFAAMAFFAAIIF